jgi:hypothetical protein
MKTLIFVYLVSLLTITPVHALTGQEWISQCDSTYNEISDSECISYLDGLEDMLSIIHKRYKWKNMVNIVYFRNYVFHLE